MAPKQYCYYRPKVFFVTLFLVGAEGGLLWNCVQPGDLGLVIKCCAVLLAVPTYFCIVDAFLPAIRRKPVFFIDEHGVTDIISWGLIEWSNIAGVNSQEAKSKGYTFTELLIDLKDKHAYAGYRHSWWRRFKMAYCRTMKGADIVIDIDALEGNVYTLFQSVQEGWRQHAQGGAGVK